MKKENKRGITLIALVVTIVVLLILAGVSISSLTGDNGIMTQAKVAKENTRGAAVKEIIDLTLIENQQNTTGTIKTRKDVIEELQNDGKLTNKEVEELNTTDKIKIGDIEVDFSGLSSVATTITELIGRSASSETQKVADSYGNPITVPAGFIVVPHDTDNVEYTYDKDDEGTSTNLPVVQDGIVIENEADGNQFV